MSNPVFDTPVYQDFVKPDNCKLLVLQGINTDTPFIWKVVEGGVQLFSLAFDEDNYYRDAQPFINAAKPMILPAFQLKDMERLLPNYYMEKDNGKYRILCNSWFSDKYMEGDRLPDLYARMVYRALVDKKIDPIYVIEIITQPA